MSDIEFLAVKEFGSKLVKDDANSTAITSGGGETDLLTITASSGKDMYYGRAGGSFRTTGSGVTLLTLRFYLNGTQKSERAYRVDSEGNIERGDELNEMFKEMAGQKVAATQIIKITGQTSNANATFDGAMACWEEDTGASPALS